jgi:hypothetical protein
MKPEIKTEYKREHYYFHRVDPTPWIPFDDEPTQDIPAKILFVVGVLMAILVLVAI